MNFWNLFPLKASKNRATCSKEYGRLYKVDDMDWHNKGRHNLEFARPEWDLEKINLQTPLYSALHRPRFESSSGHCTSRIMLTKLEHIEEEQDLFLIIPECRMCNNGLKVQEAGFRLNIKKNVLTVRAVWQWNPWPQKVVWERIQEKIE